MCVDIVKRYKSVIVLSLLIQVYYYKTELRCVCLKDVSSKYITCNNSQFLTLFFLIEFYTSSVEPLNKLLGEGDICSIIAATYIVLVYITTITAWKSSPM